MRDDASEAAALRAWTGALGPAHVRSDAATRAALGRDTRPGATDVVALLLPGDVAEVQACVAIAARHRVALHPVARGRNWGYGAARPPRDACAVLSLERLRAVRRFDPALAWIEVEPGLGFAELAGFLDAQPRGLWAPWTGGPADGSVVGHALARGLATGWVQDVAGAVTGLELVLGDGRVVRTGSVGALQGLRPRGLGPDATQLFFQSSLAVVTAMTLTLQPLPPRAQPLQFRVDDDAGAAALVERLAPALQGRLLPVQLQLFDDVAQLAALGLRPPAAGPMSAADRAAAAARWGGARWVGRGALLGEDDLQLADGRRRLAALLAGAVTRLRFDPPTSGRAHAQRRSDGLALAWWRAAEPRAPGQSPPAAGCGLSWLIAAVPQRADRLLAALAVVDAALAQAGLDRAASLRVLDGRALALVVPVLFDAADADARARAAACHADLLARLAAAGFPPLRLGVGDRPPPGSRDAALDAALARALDPDGALCRGLYTDE
jgi:4-cresol dehydrogenase (hydroxylating)